MRVFPATLKITAIVNKGELRWCFELQRSPGNRRSQF